MYCFLQKLLFAHFGAICAERMFKYSEITEKNVGANTAPTLIKNKEILILGSKKTP